MRFGPRALCGPSLRPLRSFRFLSTAVSVDSLWLDSWGSPEKGCPLVTSATGLRSHEQTTYTDNVCHLLVLDFFPLHIDQEKRQRPIFDLCLLHKFSFSFSVNGKFVIQLKAYELLSKREPQVS